MLFEKISALCQKNGLTISGLEKEVGLGNATIRGWKSSSPSVGKLRLVADYFHVSMDELLSQQDQDTA